MATYTYQGPTYQTGWPIEDRFWSRVVLDRGLTVLITNGVATQKEYTTQDEEHAADFVFRGGCEIVLTTAQYDALVAAGYASYITVS